MAAREPKRSRPLHHRQGLQLAAFASCTATTSQQHSPVSCCDSEQSGQDMFFRQAACKLPKYKEPSGSCAMDFSIAAARESLWCAVLGDLIHQFSCQVGAWQRIPSPTIGDVANPLMGWRIDQCKGLISAETVLSDGILLILNSYSSLLWL